MYFNLSPYLADNTQVNRKVLCSFCSLPPCNEIKPALSTLIPGRVPLQTGYPWGIKFCLATSDSVPGETLSRGCVGHSGVW